MRAAAVLAAVVAVVAVASCAADTFTPHGRLVRLLQSSAPGSVLAIDPASNKSSSASMTVAADWTWPGFRASGEVGGIVTWAGDNSLPASNFTIEVFPVSAGDINATHSSLCVLPCSFNECFVESMALTKDLDTAVALLKNQSNMPPYAYRFASIDLHTCAITTLATLDDSDSALGDGAEAMGYDHSTNRFAWLTRTSPNMADGENGAGCGVSVFSLDTKKVTSLPTHGASIAVPGNFFNYQLMMSKDRLYVKASQIAGGGFWSVDLSTGAISQLWYKNMEPLSPIVQALDTSSGDGPSGSGPWMVYGAPTKQFGSWPLQVHAMDLGSCSRTPDWSAVGAPLVEDCAGSACTEGLFQWMPVASSGEGRVQTAEAVADADANDACVPAQPAIHVGVLEMDVWGGTTTFAVYNLQTAAAVARVDAPDFQTSVGAVGFPQTALDTHRGWYFLNAQTEDQPQQGKLYAFDYGSAVKAAAAARDGGDDAPVRVNIVHNCTFTPTSKFGPTNPDQILFQQSKGALWGFFGGNWGTFDIGSCAFTKRVDGSSIAISNSQAAAMDDASGIIYHMGDSLSSTSVTLYVVDTVKGSVTSHVVSGLSAPSSPTQLRWCAASKRLVFVSHDSDNSYVDSVDIGTSMAAKHAPGSPFPADYDTAEVFCDPSGDAPVALLGKYTQGFTWAVYGLQATGTSALVSFSSGTNQGIPYGLRALPAVGA